MLDIDVGYGPFPWRFESVSVSLLDAAASSQTLRSLAVGGTFGLATLEALGDVTEFNPMIRSLSFYPDEFTYGNFDVVIAEALEYNHGLTSISIGSDLGVWRVDIRALVNRVCRRNKETLFALNQLRNSLLFLARLTEGGFHSLRSRTFRNKVMEMLWPSEHVFVCLKGEVSWATAGSQQDVVVGTDAATVEDRSEVAAPPDEFVADHIDPPAVICPLEAAMTQEEHRISFVEHRIASEHAGSCPAARAPPDGRKVVLLTFSASSPELDEALFSSSATEVARCQGANLRPEWAHRMKIFVGNVGPQHVEPPFFDVEQSTHSHVLVYEDDVEDLLRELQDGKGLPLRICKVKGFKARNNFPALPQEHSLIDQSSHSLDSLSVSTLADHSTEIEVVVRNTFFEIIVAAGASSTDKASAHTF